MKSTPRTYEEEMAIIDMMTPETHPARDAVHFRRIIAAQKSVDEADAELREAVAAARAAGDPWVMIGAALDMTRQAAQQRFGEPS